MSEEKKPFERLPTKVVPRNYKLELTPDLKAFTFDGKLEITVEVRKLVMYVSLQVRKVNKYFIKCLKKKFH